MLLEGESNRSTDTLHNMKEKIMNSHLIRSWLVHPPWNDSWYCGEGGPKAILNWIFDPKYLITYEPELSQWKVDGNKRNLNCFYSIFAKKRNSHSHFKYIKLHIGIVVLVLSPRVHPIFFSYFMSMFNCDKACQSSYILSRPQNFAKSPP